VSEHQDRIRWNEKYSDERRLGSVNRNLVRHVSWLKPGRVLDLAGGLGQNGAWLESYSPSFRAVNVDISDEALARAPQSSARVAADAGALPFRPYSFDTVLCIRFLDLRVDFSALLVDGGTVFFETFTEADGMYRPEFNPAHRLAMDTIPSLFAHLELLYVQEVDDGHRVYATVIAHKT
jgi:SAM-dependent methyltransferase